MGWIKSSRCDNGACIEVNIGNRTAWVRDSTQVGRSVLPVLSFSHADWRGLLADLRAGRLQ